MQNLDDKRAAWELSLFFIFCAILIAVADFSRKIEFERTLKNPVLALVAAFLFFSLTYWLLRERNVPTKKAAMVVGILLLLMLFTTLANYRFFVVMSNSMRHDGGNNEAAYKFWEKKGVPREQFDSFPISKGFSAGDLLVVEKTDNLRPGDVALDLGVTPPVTHRIVIISNTTIATAGDASPPLGNFPKSEIRDRDNIYGKVVLVVPKGGILKALYSCSLDDDCSLGECLRRAECGGRTVAWS